VAKVAAKILQVAAKSRQNVAANWWQKFAVNRNVVCREFAVTFAKLLQIIFAANLVAN
jgi:fumarate reductase subunit C